MVAVLVRSLKQNWEIAEMLDITEHTVENHRLSIRKILAVEHGIDLAIFLAAI